MYTLQTGKYSSLVWIVSKRNDDGIVEIYHQAKLIFTKRYMAETPWYDTIELEPGACYHIFCSSVQVHFAYLCGNKDVLEHGTGLLEFVENEIIMYGNSNMKDAYNQVYRNAFHFSTFKNWMNDPNGLCRYQGLYHLFYQMNPAGLKWGNTYWGHAVSRVLIHWTHLPIALFPQKELYGLAQYKGGAYSGSALTGQDGITLYFTRHFSPWKKGIETREVQVRAFSPDGIHVEKEEVIISKKPGGPKDHNFRDPKAVMIDGRINLLISATIDLICSVVRYEFADGEWKDRGIFFQDDIDCDSMECVNLIWGRDNDCALICSLQNAADPLGRKRLMKYYIGKMIDGRFRPETEGLYDFGTECYAVQTFENEGRTLAFGWIVSAYGEFTEAGSASNGCITLPRQLYLENNKLHTIPAPETGQLLYEPVTLIENGMVTAPAPNLKNQFYIRMDLTEKTAFQLILAQDKLHYLGLEYDGERLKILYGLKGKDQKPQLYENMNSVTDLELFLDKSAMEVFVNRGIYTATKTYFFEPDDRPIEYHFNNRSSVKLMEVKQIKNIWNTN